MVPGSRPDYCAIPDVRRMLHPRQNTLLNEGYACYGPLFARTQLRLSVAHPTRRVPVESARTDLGCNCLTSRWVIKAFFDH